MTETLTETLKVRIPPTLLEQLRQAATDDGRSASNMARRLIENGLALQGNEGAREAEHAN